MVAEIEEQAVKLRHDSIAEETLSPDFPLPYVTWPELLDHLQDRSFLELGHSDARWIVKKLCGTHSHSGRGLPGRLKPFIEHVADLVSENETVIVISRQSERLQELWRENHVGE